MIAISDTYRLSTYNHRMSRSTRSLIANVAALCMPARARAAMTLSIPSRFPGPACARARAREGMIFCQVATQVSLSLRTRGVCGRLLACLSLSAPPSPILPACASKTVELRQCRDWAPCRRGPKTPMGLSTPSSSCVRSSVVESSSTRRRWSERNAPAGGFSTSIAQSSGRTGRRDLAAPTPARKSRKVSSARRDENRFEHQRPPLHSRFDFG